MLFHPRIISLSPQKDRQKKVVMTIFPFAVAFKFKICHFQTGHVAFGHMTHENQGCQILIKMSLNFGLFPT